jgi:hypothetical protein
LIAQIPPKYIYADTGCQASIPDYRDSVIVKGGCSGFTLSQNPSPGTVITIPFIANEVIIKATGKNGKSSQRIFTVTMLDTITPEIIPTPAFMSYQAKQISELFNVAETMAINSFKTFDKYYVLPDSLEYAPGVGPMTDSMYNEVMLVSVSMDSAGIRKRFTSYGDSVIINPKPIEWDDILYKPTDFPTSIHIHGWEQIIHPTYLDNDALRYPVSYNDFMDWQAVAEYMPIPARTPTAAPDLSLVKATTNFTSLIYDPTAKKMKFWNGSVWKTITSN